MKITIVFVPCT